MGVEKEEEEEEEEVKKMADVSALAFCDDLSTETIRQM